MSCVTAAAPTADCVGERAKQYDMHPSALVSSREPLVSSMGNTEYKYPPQNATHATAS